MNSILLTERSFEDLFGAYYASAWLPETATSLVPDTQTVRVAIEEFTYYVHVNDQDTDPRILIDQSVVFALLDIGDEIAETALYRAHRLLLSARRFPIRLPTEWSSYHLNNLLAYFATPRSQGAYRWAAQIRPFDSQVLVAFWRLTDPSDEVQLQALAPDEHAVLNAIGQIPTSSDLAHPHFAAMPKPEAEYAPLDGSIELHAIGDGAIVQQYSYSGWLPLLSSGQRDFLKHKDGHSVKLKGPAGTGKTLALALKALHDAYQHPVESADYRILFATHSWAMAEQVDDIIHALDERSGSKHITVLPLVELAKDLLPPDMLPKNVELFGSDSLEGKRLQLECLNSLLAEALQGTWLAYRSAASEQFRLRVEAPPGSAEWNSLLWDLLHEFSSVLAASNILPGAAADNRYERIGRADWMMPLPRAADRKFVVRLYSAFVGWLRKRGKMSIDQLIKDLVNYLETFSWDYRRVAEGYDLILVDEFHLFSEPERQVFSYLTRDPNKFPRLLMALDPRQAPTELYAEFPMSDTSSGSSGESETRLGKIDSVDLTRVHRFSTQILELVRYIQHSYPTMGLGEDWVLDVSSLSSSSAGGTAPLLIRHSTQHEEVISIADRFQACGGDYGANRSAIILLNESALDEFAAEFARRGLSVVVLRGRDDVDRLRYSKKSLVLAAAEYAAGLQFGHVTIAALPRFHSDGSMLPYQWRRVLSLLYLAVTRASESVRVCTTLGSGDLQEFLDQAVADGVLLE